MSLTIAGSIASNKISWVFFSPGLPIQYPTNEPGTLAENIYHQTKIEIFDELTTGRPGIHLFPFLNKLHHPPQAKIACGASRISRLSGSTSP